MLARAVLIAMLSLAASFTCYSQEEPPAPEMPSVVAPPRAEKAPVPKGAVGGTVYCADTNNPARLAHISLLPIAKEGGRSYRGESDLEGRFRIGNLPEGKYYISAELLGYINPLTQLLDLGRRAKSDEERKVLEARVTTVYVSSSQVASVALRLERGAEIDGTVLYDDGSPAVGVHLILRPNTRSPEGADETSPTVEYMEYADQTTDDRGRYRVLGVAPGEYKVSVELSTATGEHEQNMFAAMVQSSQLGNLAVYAGDTLRASKAKTIKIGSETRADADITIPLSKLHTIRGRVVVKSTGEAPPSGIVRLLYADTREVARVAMAVDGEFEIGYVGDDSYILQASSSAEPLPKVDVDDDNGDTSFVVGSGVVTQIGDKAATERAGEIGVLVHGDVSGLVVETPDPAAPKAASTETSEVPPAPDAEPGGGSNTPPVTLPVPPQ